MEVRVKKLNGVPRQSAIVYSLMSKMRPFLAHVFSVISELWSCQSQCQRCIAFPSNQSVRFDLTGQSISWHKEDKENKTRVIFQFFVLSQIYTLEDKSIRGPSHPL